MQFKVEKKLITAADYLLREGGAAERVKARPDLYIFCRFIQPVKESSRIVKRRQVQRHYKAAVVVLHILVPPYDDSTTSSQLCYRSSFYIITSIASVVVSAARVLPRPARSCVPRRRSLPASPSARRPPRDSSGLCSSRSGSRRCASGPRR
ncbi:hypothetical protein SDC9_191117 [bioreactor metagenome]|uniref:Uncharacterized protein n=1 Tax=bioreactor metagenome TaxID=1076179 RepID=A0A645HX21_9ZZZZ